ncbi:hypothetical protein A9Q92_03065 [Methylophaga sp. 42_8_T64]|nr:hypothetical protein A9Q92_03065 [Methylophaga sp. 42_8_T64]
MKNRKIQILAVLALFLWACKEKDYTIAYSSKKSKQRAIYLSDAEGNSNVNFINYTEDDGYPSGSPDGKSIAFYGKYDTNKTWSIHTMDIDGSNFKRLTHIKDTWDSSPTWSPDGKKLALTLSKAGNPEIYVLELASGKLSRVTHNSQAIDTEAVWMPNGRELLFTSDRGGRPQIYKVSADGGRASRVTFEGRYNASADISADGRFMTMVHGLNGKYYIAVQDLDSGAVQVLTETGQDESPSFAPNSRNILYATEQNGKGILAAVSVDGRIHQRLGESGSDVREPAWSPIRK